MRKPSRIRILTAALRDIADPMVKIRKEAEEQGYKLEGRTVCLLCDDANWLKQKAKDALREAFGE